MPLDVSCKKVECSIAVSSESSICSNHYRVKPNILVAKILIDEAVLYRGVHPFSVLLLVRQKVHVL